MFTIYWTSQAQIDYFENIEYLLEFWTEKEAQIFVNTTMEYLSIIEDKPKIFQKSNYKGVYRVPIVTQVVLFYRIVNGNEVELLRFWNAAQNPKKIKLK